MKRIARRAARITALTLILFLPLVGMQAARAADVTETAASAGELLAAFSAAANAPADSVTILYDGVTELSISGGTLPANATLDLSVSGGTLTLTSGTLYINGRITGGAVQISGGTLVRETGSSITSTISTSGSGKVRAPQTLSLEGLDPLGGETITALKYAGAAGFDTTGFVCRAATGAIYSEMTGAGFATPRQIERVETDAGNIYRLGTRSTGVLSLQYSIQYYGLDGATLASENPTAYTSSDAAITLINPVKSGYLFDGWTGTGLSGLSQSVLIPEGSAGARAYTANWTQDPSVIPGGGGGGGGMGGIGGTASAASVNEASEAKTAPAETAAAPSTENSQSSVRIGRGSSSTKVRFTEKADAVQPATETAPQKARVPRVVLFAAGGLVLAAAITAICVRRRAGRDKT